MNNKTIIPAGLILIILALTAAAQPVTVDLRQHEGMKVSTPETQDIGLLWSYTAGDIIPSPPATADLNNDGKQEILFGSWDKNLHVLDAYGRGVWTHRIKDCISTTPAVADLNNDGKPEILFGSWDHKLYALDTYGKEIWTYETGGRITSTPTIINPDSDTKYLRKTEIIFGSWDGKLYALDADGNRIWGYETLGEITSQPAIADADFNKRVEVIFGSNDNSIYGIDHPEEKIWMYSTGGNIVSTPIIKDINRNGRPEIIIGSRNGVIHCLYYTEYRTESVIDCNPRWCINKQKIYSKITPRWNYSINGQIESALTVADLDGDGKSEIIFGLINRDPHIEQGISILDNAGKIKAKYTTNGRVISSPATADLNSNGQQELIIGTSKGSIYIINHTGSALWSYDLKGSIQTSPVIADLNNDGKLEIIITAGNTLYVFGSTTDSDGDGLNDYRETLIGTDPRDWDTDKDRLIDSVDPHPLVHELTFIDTDKDGLNDFNESLGGTDPRDEDTDNDGLIDSVDPHPLVHELTFIDTDKDGLNDYNETLGGTNINDNDTDRDGLIDSRDPHPLVHELTFIDTDKDGLNDYEESLIGTDPREEDSDKDDLIDSMDPHPLVHELTFIDSDGDGLNDYEETLRGTNIYDSDTDKDGLIDSVDPHPLESEHMREFYNEELSDTESTTQEESHLPVVMFVISMMGMMMVVRKTTPEKNPYQEDTEEIKKELDKFEKKLTERKKELLKGYRHKKIVEHTLKNWNDMEEDTPEEKTGKGPMNLKLWIIPLIAGIVIISAILSNSILPPDKEAAIHYMEVSLKEKSSEIAGIGGNAKTEIMAMEKEMEENIDVEEEVIETKKGDTRPTKPAIETPTTTPPAKDLEEYVEKEGDVTEGEEDVTRGEEDVTQTITRPSTTRRKKPENTKPGFNEYINLINSDTDTSTKIKAFGDETLLIAVAEGKKLEWKTKIGSREGRLIQSPNEEPTIWIKIESRVMESLYKDLEHKVSKEDLINKAIEHWKKGEIDIYPIDKAVKMYEIYSTK